MPSTTLLQLGISATPIRGADPLGALLPLPEPLPHPHPQPEPPPRGGGGTRLNNTAFIASLFSRFKEMATVSCRTLQEKIRRGDLPPLPMLKVETNKPMCLAWHTPPSATQIAPVSTTMSSRTQRASPKSWWLGAMPTFMNERPADGIQC